MVDCKRVDRPWLQEQMSSLGNQQELAIHSRVKLTHGKVRHIPIIDFTNVLSADVAIHRMTYITNMLGVPLNLYRSGNSLHGYYHALISKRDWYDYLGSLLLCNLPDKIAEDVIDSRWVGHSLRQRYSALRWSKHTDTYKEIPTQVFAEHPAHGHGERLIS